WVAWHAWAAAWYRQHADLLAFVIATDEHILTQDRTAFDEALGRLGQEVHARAQHAGISPEEGWPRLQNDIAAIRERLRTMARELAARREHWDLCLREADWHDALAWHLSHLDSHAILATQQHTQHMP